jgi:hypothetical protein
MTPSFESINPESNHDETTDSFEAMNLKTGLLRGIYAYGLERPSAFQQRAIMPIIKGEQRLLDRRNIMQNSSSQPPKAMTLSYRRSRASKRSLPSPSPSYKRSTPTLERAKP